MWAHCGQVTINFLSPDTRLLFSPQLLVSSRDGKPLVKFRYAHAQGHVLAQMSIEMVFMCPRRTAEGETYVQQSRMHCHYLPWSVGLPGTVTHDLDDSSPLSWLTKECEDEWATSKGQVQCVITGTDVATKALVFSSYSEQRARLEPRL